jgi:lipid II:glycine glycyltransferase (peptidoglycan interpeptide bridge formation enzyme)
MSDNITVKILETISPNEWDALVPHPLQTYAWGEARKEHGLSVVRFGAYEKEILVAVFQMTIHKLALGFSIGYIAQSDIPSKTVLGFIREYARKHKLIFVKWEPHVQTGEILSGLVASPHPNFYSHTREILLHGKTTEELRAGLEKKTRYNVGLAERNGVTIEEYTSGDGFHLFSDLFFSTANRKNYGGHSRAYHETIWKKLSTATMARIFLARYQGAVLAAYEVFTWKGTWYTPYSGTSTEHKEVKAKNFLLWKIIERAQESGAERIDLWGTLPDEKAGEASWAGFSSFKKGYGGEVKALPGSYDLIVYPSLYFFYGLLFKLRKWLRKS